MAAFVILNSSNNWFTHTQHIFKNKVLFDLLSFEDLQKTKANLVKDVVLKREFTFLWERPAIKKLILCLGTEPVSSARSVQTPMMTAPGTSSPVLAGRSNIHLWQFIKELLKKPHLYSSNIGMFHINKKYFLSYKSR